MPTKTIASASSKDVPSDPTRTKATDYSTNATQPDNSESFSSSSAVPAQEATGTVQPGDSTTKISASAKQATDLSAPEDAVQPVASITSPLVASTHPSIANHGTPSVGVYDGQAIARANDNSSPSPLKNGPRSPCTLMTPQQLRLLNVPAFEESVPPGPRSVAACTTKPVSNACGDNNTPSAGAISSLNDDDVSSDDESWTPDTEGETYCGLEIKIPSGLKILLRKIRPALNLHGRFSRCSFGDATCKVLVYSVAYRFQVLHHATAANLDHILFVVADETT